MIVQTPKKPFSARSQTCDEIYLLSYPRVEMCLVLDVGHEVFVEKYLGQI